MPSSLKFTGRTPAFKPAELLPAVEPPYALTYPSVPALSPRIAFTAPCQDPTGNYTEDWISTTHFYPAAWPRSHTRSAASDIFHPYLPSTSALGALPSEAKASKDEQKQRRQTDLATWNEICGGPEKDSIVLRMEELRDGMERSHHAERLTEARTAKERRLWICVNRIVPTSTEAATETQNRRKGLTLIVCHANGFHKEIFEPALASFVRKLNADQDHRGKHRIDEIWNFDTTHSGQAASVNRDVLGDTISWTDHARDVLQFLDVYLPESAGNSTDVTWLPTFLPHRGSSMHAKTSRRFVALGHSFGGAALTFALHERPTLFEGLVLIDPAIVELDETNFDTAKLPSGGLPLMVDVPLAVGAIVRKDSFGSMPEARRYFESKAFFKAWDSRVLDLHLRFGLRPANVSSAKALVADDVEENDLKRTPLELTNTKWHEAAAFASTFLGRSGRNGLLTGKHQSWTALLNMEDGFSNKALASDICKLEKGVQFTVKANHLVAQENPELLGKCH